VGAVGRGLPAIRGEGAPDGGTARRFRRGPRFIEQVEELAALDGRDAKRRRRRDGSLRPVERRILTLRERGVSTDELAERFRRSPDFVARGGRLARYKRRRAARR